MTSEIVILITTHICAMAFGYLWSSLNHPVEFEESEWENYE